MNSNFTKGVAFAKSNNYSQALKSFTASIEQHPTKFTSYLNRGCIQCCLGLDQFAIEDFNKVIQLEPYQITGYYNRFISNYKIGRKVEAQYDLYISLSLAYMKKGEETKLIKLIAKAIGLVENNALAHVKRGNLYRESNNYVMAENDYTGALQIDDKSIGALTARAGLYKVMDREEEAEEDIQKIAQLSRSHHKNKIVLTPSISKMSVEEVDADIQAKVKEFTSLRNEIFKKGYQQPVTSASASPAEEGRTENKLETTLEKHAEQVNNKQQVRTMGGGDKRSLQDLSDFVDASHSNNVNSSAVISTEKSGKDKIITSDLMNQSGDQQPLTLQYKISVTKDDGPAKYKQHVAQQNPNTKDVQGLGETRNSQQGQKQIVEVIQEPAVTMFAKQQQKEQTGDDVYGVEPSKRHTTQQKQQQRQQEQRRDQDESENENQDQDQETRSKQGLYASSNRDNVISSQDNEFLELEDDSVGIYTAQQSKQAAAQGKSTQSLNNSQSRKNQQEQITQEQVTYEQKQSKADTLENSLPVDIRKTQQGTVTNQQNDQNGVKLEQEQKNIQSETIYKDEEQKNNKPNKELDQTQYKLNAEVQKHKIHDDTIDHDNDESSTRQQQKSQNNQKQISSIAAGKVEPDSNQTKHEVDHRSSNLALEDTQIDQRYKYQNNSDNYHQSSTEPETKPQRANQLEHANTGVDVSVQQSHRQSSDIQHSQVSNMIRQIESYTQSRENANSSSNNKNDSEVHQIESQDLIGVQQNSPRKEQDTHVQNLDKKQQQELGLSSRKLDSIKLVQSIDVVEHAPNVIENTKTLEQIHHVQQAELKIQETLSDIVPNKRIQIIIESGTLTRNTEWLGKMSPYVQVQYNGWTEKTDVSQKAGENPVWGQSIHFNYAEGSQEMIFRVYDKQTFKNDDLIGEATFRLSDALEATTLNLTFENQEAGEIIIKAVIKQ